MSIKRTIPRLGLKHHILLLTLLPSLLITTILTVFFVVSRQTDAQDELIRQAASAIHYLSKSSELGLFSGDKEALLSLARTTESNDDIKSVTFFDALKKEILTTGEALIKPQGELKSGFYMEELGSQWQFQMPVYNSRIEVADFPGIEGKSNPAEFLGWVQIIADKSRLQKKQRSILLTGASIGIMGFSLLALLALKFSHSITSPLDKITKTVQRLESGDLSARVDVVVDSAAKSELQGLVQGINRLAGKVEISKQSLQQRVDKAVRELTHTLKELEEKNSQLENTRTELIEANKAKDDFLASMSHELRTPLTAILGYCELLKKIEPVDNKQAEYVNILRQASSTLLSLIDNILDFSKLKSHSIELENRPFSLETLLDDVLDLHLPGAQRKGIKLRISVDLDVPLALIGDEFRIKQIINNLVCNAIKFTSEGLVQVRVSLLKETEAFGLVFSVKDTGIGMSNIKSPDLFHSFFQENVSISRRFGGTGLGLMICKRLVDLFAGEIKLNSEKDKGTEVVFTLLNIEKQKTLDAPEIQHFADYDISLSGLTILVAEDNLFIQKLLSTILESSGAKVINVENGKMAIEMCRKRSIDLVMLDYNMPVLDGFEACKQIRQSFSSEQLPVFLITADILNAKNLDVTGIDKIIYKPINELDLLQNIVKYTSNNNLDENKPIACKKVLDFLPDELIVKEINRLCGLLQQAVFAKKRDDVKKYAHQLCGVAGPTNKYKDIEKLAREIEKYLEDENYSRMRTLIQYLQKTKAVS